MIKEIDLEFSNIVPSFKKLSGIEQLAVGIQQFKILTLEGKKEEKKKKMKMRILITGRKGESGTHHCDFIFLPNDHIV